MSLLFFEKLFLIAHLVEVCLYVVSQHEGEDDSDQLEEEDDEAGHTKPEEQVLPLLGEQGYADQ